MSAAYLANDRVPMLRVSLILEALRARPALMFWVAALAQGTLWTLVPALFYAAPPGEVPLGLAAGIALGLLLVTTYAGLILLGLMTLFVAGTGRGRSRLASIGPWAAAIIVVLINLPHLFWLERTGYSPLPMLRELPGLLLGD